MDWCAAVVVVRRGGLVLAVSRGRELDNLNLPGGHREPHDASPAATARRELEEETGLRAGRLRPLGRWRSPRRCDGLVYAFEADSVSGRLRSSHEGVAGWARVAELLRPSSTYHAYHRRLLRGR